MSLNITQSSTLNGTSTINEQQVATFSTNISAGQLYSNVTMTVTNQELYNDNKVEVRKDRDDFQAHADTIADGLDQQESMQK